MEVLLKLSVEDLGAVESELDSVDASARPLLKTELAGGALCLASLRALRPHLSVCDLFQRGCLELPSLPPPPPRPAELEERLERLRREAEAVAYDEMTKEVSGGAKLGRAAPAEPSFGAELRSADRTLTTIINMVLTVAGAFFFGFKV